MTIGSGLDAQLGLGVETPVGTRATPTIFFRFIDEGIQLSKGRIVSKGIGLGRRMPSLWRDGVQEVKGPLRWEFAPQGIDKVLEWWWGGTPSKSGFCSSAIAHSLRHEHVDVPLWIGPWMMVSSLRSQKYSVRTSPSGS